MEITLFWREDRCEQDGLKLAQDTRDKREERRGKDEGY